MKDANLTPEELLAIDHTVALWNTVVQLPTEHPDDLSEVRGHIHAIQNLIAARPTWRVLNGVKKAPATKLFTPKPPQDGNEKPATQS